MRKAQKKQADDFMKLLGQAHEEIIRSIEKKNIQTALKGLRRAPGRVRQFYRRLALCDVDSGYTGA